MYFSGSAIDHTIAFMHIVDLPYVHASLHNIVVELRKIRGRYELGSRKMTQRVKEHVVEKQANEAQNQSSHGDVWTGEEKLRGR